MKKIILFLFLSLVLLTTAKSQAVMQTKEWKELITNLQNENWQVANELSLSMLNKITKDGPPDDVASALLRYMNIRSEAGLMTLEEVSKAEAIKKVVGFTGQMIILPSHPISLKRDFNSIRLVHGKSDSLSITASNKNATVIFSFEYIILDKPWPVDDFKNNAGNKYRLGGIIRSITVEGSDIFPSFRIILEHGMAEMEK